MEHGFRLLSSYRTNVGDKYWIIRESDRSVTTWFRESSGTAGQSAARHSTDVKRSTHHLRSWGITAIRHRVRFFPPRLFSIFDNNGPLCYPSPASLAFGNSRL